MKNIKVLTCILFIFLLGCDDNIPDRLDMPDYSLSEYLYQVMIEEQWYLWVDEVDPPSPEGFSNPNEYLDTLKYDKYDKWSYIQNIEAHDAFFGSGEQTGYGFRYETDEIGNMRVAMVVKDSPFDQKGIKRGYIIKKINDQLVGQLSANELREKLGRNEVGVSAKFTFIDRNGNELTETIAKATITQKAVHYQNIYAVDGKKVGYFVFNSFIQPALGELETLFSNFKGQAIDELVIDLRYNGGGQTNVAKYIGDVLAGSKADGQVFNTLKFNEYKAEHNESTYFEKDVNSMGLERVFFITTSGSASASELLINSLKPFMGVILVGNPTHGKPVGMRTFRYKDMVASFINFKSVNANGQGDYFDGIPVDAQTRDGLEKEFGDITEDCLQQALHYIETGSFLKTLKSQVVGKKHWPYAQNAFEMAVGFY